MLAFLAHYTGLAPMGVVPEPRSPEGRGKHRAAPSSGGSKRWRTPTHLSFPHD